MQGSATDGGPDPGAKKIKVHMDADLEDASHGHKLTEAERRRVRRSVQAIRASVHPCLLYVSASCLLCVSASCLLCVCASCLLSVCAFCLLCGCASCLLSICASCLLTICASVHPACFPFVHLRMCAPVHSASASCALATCAPMHRCTNDRASP